LALSGGHLPLPRTRPRHAGIVALVNGNIISNYDLDQHIALFAVTSGNPVTQETLPEIRLQVLTSLEDQAIELQEAGRHRITVTNTEVDKEVQSVAEDNHLSVEQMIATVTRAGVSLTTFRSTSPRGLLGEKW
jgi:peptidyl-prolyl cis-trans isomerase SurA